MFFLFFKSGMGSFLFSTETDLDEGLAEEALRLGPNGVRRAEQIQDPHAWSHDIYIHTVMYTWKIDIAVPEGDSLVGVGTPLRYALIVPG